MNRVRENINNIFKKKISLSTIFYLIPIFLFTN